MYNNDYFLMFLRYFSIEIRKSLNYEQINKRMVIPTNRMYVAIANEAFLIIVFKPYAFHIHYVSIQYRTHTPFKNIEHVLNTNIFGEQKKAA